MRNYLFFQIFFLVLLLSACQQTSGPNYTSQTSSITDTAMIVSAHPLATRAGLEVLRRGGNAVDATVAVQFALAVVYPRAGNIGGGGFMVIRQPDGTSDAIDYREASPAAALRDMYLNEKGEVISERSQRGHLAAGVPGTVDGLLKAWEKYGRLTKRVAILDPAIRLAREGFQLSATEADRLNRFQEDLQSFTPDQNPFIRRKPWRAGDLLVQPDLARTLERIREQGRAGFYAGKTAQLVEAEMQAGGGLITTTDLKNYQAKWREPIVFTYKNYRIISMSPPSSGGIALGQLFGLVEPYPIEDYGFQSARTAHLMVEAMRRVYADRAEYLGDPDYVEIPVMRLMDSAYLVKRMDTFDPNAATVSDTLLAGDFAPLPESFETTHTSTVDESGMAVSVTTTINSNYGSKVMVRGAGFFLNNEMDDFSAKPGVPNIYGLIGAEANSIAPGKRMLSSMTPTIIERNDSLYLVLGTPGGSTIITSVFQVALNVMAFDMPIDSAVAAPRFHHQWLPDHISVERNALTPDVRQALRALGHSFKDRSSIAIVKAIHVLPDGRLHGTGDPRNPDDHAEGI